MTNLKSLKARSMRISGISSLVRDLSIISDSAVALERAILEKENELNRFISPNMELRTIGLNVEIGDVVLFSPKAMGGYETIETLWGDYAPLIPNEYYVGVICNRGSTRLYAAQLPVGQTSYHDADLQIISAAGGIGYCTGFSPSLFAKSGHRHAADVDIVGVFFNIEDQSKVNINSHSRKFRIDSPRSSRIPKVLVLGTGTDVGKSTAMRRLLNSASKYKKCVAGKFAGTGAYEDTGTYMDAGALLALDFTNVGLGSTYYSEQSELQSCFRGLEALLDGSSSVPKFFLPPEKRSIGHDVSADIMFVEMGGDFNWAGIPTYLGSIELMEGVAAIIICCESSLSLYGAIQFLKDNSIYSTASRPIFVSMPLLNPEAFYLRYKQLQSNGDVSGLFDVNKSSSKHDAENDIQKLRKEYSANSNNIHSCDDIVHKIIDAAAERYCAIAP